MPVCNECNRFSDGQTADCCEHCGAKDWKAESRLARFWRVAKKDTANLFAPRKKTAEEEEVFRPIVGCVGVVLWAVVAIGAVLGGLWLVITVIRFMWGHS